MSAHIVVMGVSGCGKSTVAESIRDRLGFEMAEGDDLHPKVNVEKMHAGIPLTDEDRWPWLARIADWVEREDAQGVSTVVSCSALKRSYRDVLRRTCPIYFIHLAGAFDVIAGRMAARQGHFMPSSLLKSQFDTLEALEADEDGCVVDVADEVDKVEAVALKAASAYAARCDEVAKA